MGPQWRGWSLVIVVVALMHAGAYIVHQRADWANELVFSDQGEFEALGRNLLMYGRYTRYPEASPPIAESERTPGYPLLLAGVYTLFGTSRMAVVLVQSVFFALISLLVLAMATAVWSRRVGIVAGLATALYPPFAYWSALALTEVTATLCATFAVFCLLRGLSSGRWPFFVLAGFAFGYLTLTRPVWVLLPPVLAVVLAVVGSRAAVRPPLQGRLAVMVGATALVLVPWLGFVYVHFHIVSLNPIAGWRSVYWGYWHGVFPGRKGVLVNEVGESDLQGEALSARLREIGPDVERMRAYIEERRQIDALWRGIPDVHASTQAKFAQNTAARAAVLRHLREGDFWNWVYRRLSYGSFTLWAADIPIRYSLINATPTLVIRLIEGAQLLILAFGVWGVVILARQDRLAGVVLLVPLVYTELVHLPIHSDIRFSLPVKPLLLFLAVLGARGLVGALALRRGVLLSGTTGPIR